MKEFKHIVYLMLENRSFDHLLGWLYDENNPPCVNPKNEPTTYDGLKEQTYFNKDKGGNKHYVVKGTNHNMNVPIHDPHEKYCHINKQVFGKEANPNPNEPPTMGGFYQDFASYHNHPKQIMKSYTPEELPVLNGLARNFAVSDRYFCSVPTQTNCNRAFAAGGNSLGLTKENVLKSWVNNRNFSFFPFHISQPKGKQFNQKTMWNVLSEHGLKKSSDWMHYHSHGALWDDFLGIEGYSYTRDLMEQLQDKSFDHHFGKIETFYKKAKEGKLPSVCFLEPEWGLEYPIFGDDIGINGNDYHPPTNLHPGEKFLKKIYEHLTHNKEAWDQTLWIINFDEHGGTYDHVDPPWHAEVPWSGYGTPTPTSFEEGFHFNRFGVRVPLILVTPRALKSTVFRAEHQNLPYDHTSVIASILTMMGIPKEKWGLGARTHQAPTFDTIFDGNPIREKVPVIEVNSVGKDSADVAVNAPPNDIQMQMAHSLLRKAFHKKGLTNETIKKMNLTAFTEAKTLVELKKMLRAALKKVKDA